MATYNIIKIDKDLMKCKDISLRAKSRYINTSEFGEHWLHNLVSSMFETLYSNPSGVGLAAPQIGFQLRILVIDINRDGKKPCVMINPFITPLDDEMVLSKEGCLSIPGYLGEIERLKRVTVNYETLKGDKCSEDVDGFKAAVIQHEIDHLDGILYTDRLLSPDSFYESQSYAQSKSQLTMSKLI